MFAIFISMLLFGGFFNVDGGNTTEELQGLLLGSIFLSYLTIEIVIPVLLTVILTAIIIYLFLIYCRKPPQYHLIEVSGPSGLKNSQESCYMNSLIQAIASSDNFKNDCDQLTEKLQNLAECPKMGLFMKIIKNINNPRDRRTCFKDNTKDLKKLMKEIGWRMNNQEDAFQLLSKVINSIQTEFTDVLKENKIIMPPKMKLLHSFSENSNWNKVQEHLGLALPLCGDFRNKPGVELEALMDAVFEPSKIEDSSNEMQLSLFQKAPNVMILHVQANEWNAVRGEYIKPKYYIIYKDNMKYTFNIQMKKDGSEIKKEKVEYGLRAVVHHMGSVTGGHYVTYRVHNGRWYLTNDEQVEETSFNSDIIPYIMVYEKINEEEINNEKNNEEEIKE